MRKCNENPQNFPELYPKPHQGSALDLLMGGGGAHSTPETPQLIIAIAVRSFSENSKKTQPANFSLFQPLVGLILKSCWYNLYVNPADLSNDNFLVCKVRRMETSLLIH